MYHTHYVINGHTLCYKWTTFGGNAEITGINHLISISQRLIKQAKYIIEIMKSINILLFLLQ